MFAGSRVTYYIMLNYSTILLVFTNMWYSSATPVAYTSVLKINWIACFYPLDCVIHIKNNIVAKCQNIRLYRIHVVVAPQNFKYVNWNLVYAAGFKVDSYTSQNFKTYKIFLCSNLNKEVTFEHINF